MMSKEIIIPTSLDEITLGQYLRFAKESEGLVGDGSITDILKSYKLVEILTNTTEEELDELKPEEMNELVGKLSDLINNFQGFDKKVGHITIDGVDYVPQPLNEIDNGIRISLDILREQYSKDNYVLFPKLLAVLLRPGKKSFDQERKEEIYEIEKFNRRDIANLDLRAEIFTKKALAGELIPIVNFFLSGKERLEQITSPFSEPIMKD